MHTPDFIRRTDTGSSNLALRGHAPRVLEVHLLWDDLVLDTQHHLPDSPALTVGDAVGWRWSCLGIDMGWIRPEFRHLAAVAPPLWSEVDQRPTCDLFAPSELLDGEEKLELVRWEEGEAVVHVPRGWTAEVGGHGQNWAFVAEETISVPTDAVLRLRRDSVSLVFSRVRAPASLAGRPQIGPDGPFAGMFSVVAGLGLLFGIAMWNQPPTPKNEVVEIPQEIVSLVYQAPEPPPPAPKVEDVAAPKPKAKGDEGTPGERQGKKVKTKAAKGDERDRQAVNNSGIFQAWGDPSLAGLSSGGLADGLENSIGGLVGKRGVQLGHGGLGDRGFGPGGGGNAETTTIQGRCIGNIEDCGAAPIGVIGGDGTKPGSSVPQVQDAILIGNMDRSLIDEVIKRHMPAIRYCYQQELQREPDLSGKIVVGFTIAGDGSVARATPKRSSLGNDAVESCVVGRFLKMQFPKPKGGGIVIVSYPFLFAPG
ncbi:MAG: energy transducer TonB [Deltaproteobacteria bacterium]|nr:MAG: energy transducer TonB [Deltaproteobacteria bacterium]